MATFGKKIIGLAAAAVGFAGMAFGQSCATATAQPNFIRAEGTTEALGNITVNCTGLTTGQLALQVFIAPSLPITNKVTSGTIDATATPTGGAAVSGTVAGTNQINFTVPVTAATTSITVQNIRVNANQLTVSTGLPPAVTATVFTSGSGVPSAGSANVGNVAFAQNGLGSVKVFKNTPSSTNAGANNFPICNATTAVSGSPAYVLQINEGFNSAFKSQAGEGVNATQGTRLMVTFANLPQNGLTAYLPTSVSSNGATITLTSSATGAFSAVAAGTSSTATALGSYASVSVSGGSFSAIYDVQAQDPSNLDQFNIPVYFSAAANPGNASGTSTVSVAFAPTGTTSIPNFNATSSTTTVSASGFTLCTTSLLFPFVTNASGFDTGLAISNTSADPFGTTNGATAQSGTCTLNFYGATTNPTAVTTASVAAGTVYTNLISSVAAGFQGYMIAQCNFQFAHGFAFITDGFGGGGRGLSQGYLALVIPDVTLTGGRRTNAAGESLTN